MNTITLYIALAVLAAAVVLFVLSSRTRKEAGLPGGRVIYRDTRGWGKLEKPLFDSELGLTGKPDYLVEQNGKIIPVEVKTGRTPPAPYDSHVFQVAAYCYLVQKTYGKRPTHGIIHYPERDFAVDYTQELESALKDLIDHLRVDERRPSVPRSHQDPNRCLHCGYQDTCDEKLV